MKITAISTIILIVTALPMNLHARQNTGDGDIYRQGKKNHNLGNNLRNNKKDDITIYLRNYNGDPLWEYSDTNSMMKPPGGGRGGGGPGGSPGSGMQPR